MSTHSKPRSDSPLKTLPEARQADIAEYLKAHSLAETAAWLKLDGIKTSATALGEFGSWYSLRQQLSRNSSTVETLLAEFLKANPKTSPEKIQAMGQSFFSALALEQQDIKAWFLTQQLGLKKEQLRLDVDKFQFDAAMAALKCAAELKVISTSKLSEAEKVNAARKKLFGELPA
jgi:hypothetical protein